LPLGYQIEFLLILLILRHRIIGTTRTLALQCGHERELQKFAPFLGARCFVGKLQELPPEPVNLLAYASIVRETMGVSVTLTPALEMFAPPCFEMCCHRHVLWLPCSCMLVNDCSEDEL
jgi:hypothetical protein